jgi:hypothetical protein
MLFACLNYAIRIIIAKIEYIREIFSIKTPGEKADKRAYNYEKILNV